MSRKTKFLALSFVLITPLSINAFKKAKELRWVDKDE